MKIPKRFSLLGHKYTVRIVPRKDWEDFELWGLLNPKTREMLILESTQSQMEHIFFHELVHATLIAMGRHELNKDESFIDLQGGLIHQALTTAKY